MSRLFSSNNKVIAIVMASLVFLLTFAVFGYYYYWIDDVLVDNFFRGLFLAEPLDHFFTIHILTSRLYAFLYQIWPQFPVMGVLMACYIFLATINLFYFLLNRFSNYFEGHKWQLVLILVLLYFLVWIENVFLINMTRVAILLIGTSYINLHRHFSEPSENGIRYSSIAYYITTLMIGLLSRPEVATILFPFLLTWSFFSLLPKHKLSFVRIFLLVILLYGSYKVIDRIVVTEEMQAGRDVGGHILNINDGENHYDFSEISGPSLKARLIACRLYFFPDQASIDKSFLDQVGPSSPLTKENLEILNPAQQLRTELDKARYAYSYGYHSGYNWYWKSIGFLSFNILLMLISLIYWIRGRNDGYLILKQFVLFGVYLASAFSIALLFKMEDRVLTSSFILLSIVHLDLVYNNTKPTSKPLLDKLILTVLILFGLVLTINRIKSYTSITKEKEIELAHKAEIIEEINRSFSSKYIFYDLWAMTLIHQRPIDMITLNSSNKHLIYGEHWSNFLDDHVEYLEQWCGSSEFIPFYECLYEIRDDVVFLFLDLRKEQIELYADLVYDKRIRFKRMDFESRLQEIKYSYFGTELDLDYYTFDDSFEDADSIPADNHSYFEDFLYPKQN